MRIRSAAATLGLLATFGGALLTGSALAGPATAETTPDYVAQGRALLASYVATNQQLATCMKAAGLTFNSVPSKADIIDAYTAVTASGVLSASAQAEVDKLVAQALDDPNAAILEALSAAKQATWTTTLDNCGVKIDSAAAGTPAQQAAIAAKYQAALASTEVKAAAATYVTCMKSRGFTVTTDINVAPQNVMDAEDVTDGAATAAATTLITNYEAAWKTCSQPYQDTYDKKLFG